MPWVNDNKEGCGLKGRESPLASGAARSRGPSGRMVVWVVFPGRRVARGAYAPPALTEPDLWAHIRLFGTPTFRTAPVVRCRCCHPQLSQIQYKLDRADDGLVA